VRRAGYNMEYRSLRIQGGGYTDTAEQCGGQDTTWNTGLLEY